MKGYGTEKLSSKMLFSLFLNLFKPLSSNYYITSKAIIFMVLLIF